jgi:hypothetical protein
MFSQSVVAHAEMPLNERVEDRSTVPAEDGAPVTIEELRIHHCRWPLGAVHAKPPFLYCGERALAGKPYCDEHCARAFQVRREASAPGIRVSASRIPNQASTPRTEGPLGFTPPWKAAARGSMPFPVQNLAKGETVVSALAEVPDPPVTAS